jgi:hypothetical protein
LKNGVHLKKRKLKREPIYIAISVKENVPIMRGEGRSIS